MFPRDRRLRRRRDITTVLKRGRRYLAPGMMVRVIASSEDHPRATVVVGTVVDKRAVVRNRLKRQLRHQLIVELKKRTVSRRGVDIMLTARRELLNQAPAERARQLSRLLDQAHL